MKKNDLIEAVAEKTGSTKTAAKAAVEAVFETISETLAKGEEVRISGFGSFETKERAARTCANPRTGEKMEIAAAKAVSFHAGKGLKDSVSE